MSGENDPAHEELITIARVARPHGVRGEVVADLLTDFPERFAARRTIQILLANGFPCALELQQGRVHKGRAILKFAGHDTVESVEKLRDARLVVPRSQLTKLPGDTWYEFELIGCEVFDSHGTRVGTVSAVRHYGAAPLLEISDTGKEPHREYLVPLTRAICPEVDTTGKRIVIDPPEGLLDL
ncbi:MAG: ribosome maturation factor RimM [Blastocatellia bacterium]